MSTTLNQALVTLRRRYGDGVITAGDGVAADPVWATGIPAIDAHLTPGGMPRGRISVLAATSRAPSGRLTLLQALAAIASRQRIIAYLDLAGSLDPGFLADLGADLESVLVVRPLVRAGAAWLGVALGPSCSRASAWEHRLSALAEAVSECGAVCLVSAPAPPPTPLAYASSLSLRCEAVSWQEVHGDIVGLRTRVTTVKSKISTPGAEATLLLRYPRPFANAEVVGVPGAMGLEPSQAHPSPGALAG